MGKNEILFEKTSAYSSTTKFANYFQVVEAMITDIHFTVFIYYIFYFTKSSLLLHPYFYLFELFIRLEIRKRTVRLKSKM